MSVLSRIRHRIPKPLAVGTGLLLGLAGLVVGGWLLWSMFRPPPDGFAPTGGQAIQVADQPSTVLQYTIDARSRRHWAYFDFSSRAAVSASPDSLDWDLAFRRTDLLTNGGETNPAGAGGALDFGNVPLGDIKVPPDDGYLVDATHDDRGLENPALHGWYSYDWIKHIVDSKNHAYAIRTSTGELALLTFLSYYCEDGSSGCITFQYVYPVSPAIFASES